MRHGPGVAARRARPYLPALGQMSTMGHSPHLGALRAAHLAAEADPLVVDGPHSTRAAGYASRSCSVLSGSLSCVLGLSRQPVRDAVHVRVHRDALHDAKAHVEHDVGGLPAHARQARELLHRVGHLAAVRRLTMARAASTAVARLALAEAQAPDDLGHLPGRRRREVCRRGPAPEQLGRHLVHLGVRRLGGERRGDDEPEGAPVVEEALDRPVHRVQALAELYGPRALGGVRLAWHMGAPSNKEGSRRPWRPRPQRIR